MCFPIPAFNSAHALPGEMLYRRKLDCEMMRHAHGICCGREETRVFRFRPGGVRIRHA